ncbi:hypothetical protein MMC09_006075 [Bachmanniomyces sp. S44760]|nr:hypothetical protein [Bachmanniomyces sp. S44760]
MAKKFSGDGYAALKLDEAAWETLFGQVYGNAIHAESKRYSNERIQYGHTFDRSIGLSSFLSLFMRGQRFTKEKRSELEEVGILPPSSTSSATDLPTTSPPQNRSMKTPHGPRISISDLRDRHGKAGIPPLGVEAREQDGNNESRIRRPFGGEKD